MQPWDFFHVDAASGLTLFNAREQIASAGNISGADSFAPNMLSARPFFVGDEGLTVSGIRLAMNGADRQGLVRVGIYRCPPPSAHDLYPSALVAELGVINVNGSNTPGITFTPVELEPGLYYVATLAQQVTNTLMSGYSHSAYGGPSTPLGIVPGGAAAYVGFTTYYQYGPLPATYPALRPGAFGQMAYVTSGVTFYVQSANPGGGLLVSISYNAALPTNTTAVTSDTASSVAVQFGPNTATATVAAALNGTPTAIANLAPGAQAHVGVATTMPNFGSISRTLHPAGPLRNNLFQSPAYLPLTSFSVDP